MSFVRFILTCLDQIQKKQSDETSRLGSRRLRVIVEEHYQLFEEFRIIFRLCALVLLNPKDLHLAYKLVSGF